MMGIWVVGYYKTINILEARQDGINSYYMAKIYSRDTEQARLHTDPRNIVHMCTVFQKNLCRDQKFLGIGGSSSRHRGQLELTQKVQAGRRLKVRLSPPWHCLGTLTVCTSQMEPVTTDSNQDKTLPLLCVVQ